MASVESRRLKRARAWCLLSGMVGLVLLLADLRGGRPTVVRYAERFGLAYDVAPDGKRVVYGTEDGKLRLLDLATGKARALRLPGPAARRGFPAFSPDGQRVAYSAASDLWLASVDGGRGWRLTNESEFSEFAPAFSPDGQMLVFARARNNPYSPTGVVFIEYDVFIVRRDGTGLRRLTNARYRDVTGPQFTPDGRKVVFAARVRTDDLGGSRAALLEVDPWSSRMLPPREIAGATHSDGGSHLDSPDISPDGGRIACISDRADPYRYDVCLLSRDGATFRTLARTRPNQEYRQPRFSPDGARVYYLVNDTLWSVGLHGQDPRHIAPLTP